MAYQVEMTVDFDVYGNPETNLATEQVYYEDQEQMTGVSIHIEDYEALGAPASVKVTVEAL